MFKQRVWLYLDVSLGYAAGQQACRKCLWKWNLYIYGSFLFARHRSEAIWYFYATSSLSAFENRQVSGQVDIQTGRQTSSWLGRSSVADKSCSVSCVMLTQLVVRSCCWHGGWSALCVLLTRWWSGLVLLTQVVVRSVCVADKVVVRSVCVADNGIGQVVCFWHGWWSGRVLLTRAVVRSCVSDTGGGQVVCCWHGWWSGHVLLTQVVVRSCVANTGGSQVVCCWHGWWSGLVLLTQVVVRSACVADTGDGQV